MKHCLLFVSVLFFSSLLLGAEVLPEQQSAPLAARSTPAVQYWHPPGQTSLAVQTLPALNTGGNVPLRKEAKLLVFLYHNIVFGRTGNTYNRDLYNFEHDLLYIKRNFTVTNFKELLLTGKTATTDQAIITFDDGDLSLYAIMYPLFKEYELEATIFLIPNFIGEVGYMSWDQVKEMSRYRTKAGKKLFYFESHSLTHRMLGELSKAEIHTELQRSKQIIEEQTGETVSVLALPFGSGEGREEIISEAYDLGYQAIRTSRAQAVAIKDVNPWAIGAMNVENYSSDVMVQKALALIGR